MTAPAFRDVPMIATKSRLTNATPWRFAPAAILLIAAILRWFRIESQSLWYDEGYSLFFSGGRTISETVARTIGANASERFQPAYFVLLHLWRAAFGSSEVSLRSFSVVVGLAAVGMVYVAASQLLNRTTALLAGVGMSISAFAVIYSQEVRPYSLIMVVAAVQLCAATAIVVKSPETRRWTVVL